MYYLINYYPRVIELFLEHILITVITLGISLLIAFPTSVFASRSKRLGNILAKLFSIIYTIPSMSFFALLVPFIGLGMKTAIISLVMYSQFILIRNITKGLEEVPKEVIDAGIGSGLNKKQIFFQIEIPLAMPVILAGIRITIIAIISIATIAAWINAGGLGELIFEGLAQDHSSKILIGTVLVASLSIGSNLFIQSMERRYLDRI